MWKLIIDDCSAAYKFKEENCLLKIFFFTNIKDDDGQNTCRLIAFVATVRQRPQMGINKEKQFFSHQYTNIMSPKSDIRIVNESTSAIIIHD